MSSDEFADWVAFYHMNPFGPGRGDLNAAFVCTVLASIHAKEGKPKPKPADFLPQFEKPRRLTADEMLGQYRRVANKRKPANA